MPCFFCNSNLHASQFCDIYFNDESREEFIKSKNLCCFCLNLRYFDDHHEEMNDCRTNLKCFICFTKSQHQTFLCPYRSKTPKLFIPKIDSILLLRFTKMLSLEETLSIVSFSPDLPALINFVPLNVVNNLKFQKEENYSNIVVGNDLSIEKAHSPLFTSALLKGVILKPASVFLIRTNISIQDFFQLLSTKTTELKFFLVKFESTVKFEDILKRTPIIEKFEMIHETNIEVGKTWIQDILKYKKGNNLKRLRVTVNDGSFSSKDLVTLIKTKSVTDVWISVDVMTSPHKPCNAAKLRKSIGKKYEKSFIPVMNYVRDRPVFEISFRETPYPNIYNYLTIASEMFSFRSNV